MLNYTRNANNVATVAARPAAGAIVLENTSFYGTQFHECHQMAGDFEVIHKIRVLVKCLT